MGICNPFSYIIYVRVYKIKEKKKKKKRKKKRKTLSKLSNFSLNYFVYSILPLHFMESS